MDELKRLTSDHVPVLKRVWIHNNDVVGIGKNGEPVIIATLEEEEEEEAREVRKRPPRKKKEPITSEAIVEST